MTADTAPTPAIELRHATRGYGRGDEPTTPALDDISLTVAPGELVAICGPSGSGKSTLLHLAGGLDRPTTGDVRIAGTSVTDLSPTDLARLRNRTLGFVFQSFNLLHGLSARENVELPGVIANEPAQAIRARADALLDLVGLADKSDRKPSQLSGGEQQRVAVARALVLDPPIVLADEPTGNLDSHAGREVFDLLLSVHRDGRTVVVVTHDQRLAARAGRVVYLRDGRIAQDAPTARRTGRPLRSVLRVEQPTAAETAR